MQRLDGAEAVARRRLEPDRPGRRRRRWCEGARWRGHRRDRGHHAVGIGRPVAVTGCGPCPGSRADGVHHRAAVASLRSNLCSSSASTPACPGAATAWSQVTRRPHPVRSRSACSAPTRPPRCPLRLAELWPTSGPLLDEFRPVAVAVERVLFQVNVRTAMSVGQASGVVMAEAAVAGMDVVEYSPNQVKDAVAGYGAADKDQVQRMVQILLDLDAVPRAARRRRRRGDRADPRRAHRRTAATLPARREGADDRIRCAARCSTAPTTELLVEVGGLGYRVQVTPATVAGAGDVGARGVPARAPPPAGGRRDALRVHLDRGAPGVRDADRHPRRRPVARPGHPVGALAARAAPRPGHRRRGRAVPGARAWARRPRPGCWSSSRAASTLPDVDISAAAVGRGRRGGAHSVRSDVRDALGASSATAPTRSAGPWRTCPTSGDSSELLREALQRLAAA